MDNCTIQSIKEIFGTDFQNYCTLKKIVLKENKCNNFMVPNEHILKNCLDTLNRYKVKVNSQLKQIQKYRSAPNFLNEEIHPWQTLHKQYKINQKKKQKFCEKRTDVSSNLFLTNLHLQLYLYDTSSVLPTYTSNMISTNNILNTAKNGSEIYEFIIKKTMKDIVIVDYENSIPAISSLLEQFQKRHKRFHYSNVLKQLTQEQTLVQILKCNYKISMNQLKSFFNLIFAKVVPLNIFGKLRNHKKIKKTMFHLLNTPRFKSFNLMPLIEKLDISSIKWLTNIRSTKIQLLVIAKFVKWFFTGFLIKILRAQFHVTTLSTTSNERLYITCSTWLNIQKKFMKKKINSNFLQPDIEYNEWCPPIGIYKLRLKHCNVRPLLISKHQKDEKKKLNIVSKFLKQVYVTEYGSTNFKEKWKSIIQRKHNSKTDKFYLVSCDVADAFGSIIQSQLYDIIQLLCNKLPQMLVLRLYAVKSKQYTDYNTVCYKQYFCSPHLQLPLPPGSLYAYANYSNSQWIHKSWLLERIWKYIFYQRVKIREKTYIISKGIAQGTMLSPILSDIYYSYIMHKQMATFLNCGEIIRYVDDVLYCTENEIFAKQFLQLTKEGIPQYNCYFKKLKTHSNIYCHTNITTNNINYIGYKINCNTLEIEPEYPNTDIRYLISFSLKNNITPLEFLKQRLHNVASLKLSTVVLDSMINSKTTIIKILQEACLRQAKRAYILIKELFVNVQENVQDIFKIIKSSNKKIAKHVIKSILTLDEKMSESSMCTWNIEILHILWISYKCVFQKDKILRKYFTKIYIK